MKAIITDKSVLNWTTLTRHYTFSLLTDNDEPIATNQSVECRPAEIRNKLDEIKNQYEAVLAEANDVEVGEEV